MKLLDPRAASRPRGRAGTFVALRFRNYRLYSAASLASTAGTWMQVVAQNWLVFRLTGSTAALGAAVSLQAVPSVVLGAWGGVLADRLDRRRFLICTQVAHALLAAALAVMSSIGFRSVHPLLVVAVLTGALSAIEGPASSSFSAELVPRAFLGNALALGSAISSTGRVLGMAVAGMIVGAFGSGPVFLLNAVSYLAVVAGLLALRRDEMLPAPRIPKAPRQMRAAGRYVLANPSLLVVLALAWFLSAFGRNFGVTMAAMTDGPLGTGAAGYGHASTVFAVGAFAGALVAARLGGMTRRVLVVSAAVAVVAVAVATRAFVAARPEPAASVAPPVGDDTAMSVSAA